MSSEASRMPATGNDRAKATNIALPTMAALCCLGLILFAIAATIILALIPVFTATKDVTVNNGTSQSKETSMYVEVEEEASGRRKRAYGDLYRFAGGSCDATGRSSVRSSFLSVLPTKIVSDVSVSSITFACGTTAGGGRRRSVSKRDTIDVCKTVYMVIKFVVSYKSGCLFSCQNSNKNVLRTALYTLDNKSIFYSGVSITKNGVTSIATQVRWIRIAFLSIIVPALSSETDSSSLPSTIDPASATTSTTPTTTDTTTANVNG